jgi:cellulose synthase/poly-beta-1,6-N-acetylglucosamine synthase-like glycosyltransferase
MIFLVSYFYGNSAIFKVIIIVKEFLFKIPLFFFRYVLFFIVTLFFIFMRSIDKLYYKNKTEIKLLRKYVNDCKKLKRFNRNKIYNKNPYISVCIAALNMKYFIERNIISILNQSFQNFEIIIVNDGSTDETGNIIKRMQSNEKKIKLLTHTSSLGVYRSRIESILNSSSNYIILMDPDDMYLNEHLFQKLYDYNKNMNLDIKSNNSNIKSIL